MQQPPPMFPVMPSFPPTAITTEQIQKYLDENKKLILAILDNQNLGKLGECAQYQAQLQKNLMYLAAIADAQPQPSMVPTQLNPHPGIQQGGYLMQHPQASAQRAPFGSPHQLQGLQMHQTLRPLPTDTHEGNAKDKPGGGGGGADGLVNASSSRSGGGGETAGKEKTHQHRTNLVVVLAFCLWLTMHFRKQWRLTNSVLNERMYLC